MYFVFVCVSEYLKYDGGWYQFIVYLGLSKAIFNINFNRIIKVFYAVKILLRKASKTTSFKMDVG